MARLNLKGKWRYPCPDADSVYAVPRAICAVDLPCGSRSNSPFGEAPQLKAGEIKQVIEIHAALNINGLSETT